MRIRRLSLFWKIWLSTSVALTALFAITGWILQRDAFATTARNLEQEVKASFQAYDSLWKARAELLASVASLMSSMPNVRAAFGTGDAATIRDLTGELWSKIAYELKETALFLVTDPSGRPIASLAGRLPPSMEREWPAVRQAAGQFPRQVLGFFVDQGRLFQLVLTPVYVDTPRGPALINVLITGYEVNHQVASRLKEATGGSEFLFLAPGRVFASTLNDRATGVLARRLQTGVAPDRAGDGVAEYAPLIRNLIDVEGQAVGRLCVLRSFESARQSIADLRRNVILIWVFAVAAGLALTHLLARRIVEPLKALDRAATEVARQNYDYRVPATSEDELGRLATTFNTMCESIQTAREELIRRERISTIGRLASSIVHDLRNPLAAIYGGAEMLVDTELSPPQVQRLAGNIYRASRRIQEMLQDLVNVSRGKTGATEICALREVIAAAVDTVRAQAETRSVAIRMEIPEDLELPLERARLERVFLNLIDNALEAMPEGGEIRITARVNGADALIQVEDTGPGISADVRRRLFQPFVTHGKKNGLGLGLALSRQTALDHGGDMWAAPGQARGARFYLRLPLEKP